MKQKLKLFLKGILVMLLLAMKSLPCNAIGAYGAVDFNRLTNRNGLSNSQVNAIFKDQKGYVWFGTQSGLDRFDGFRMKAFLYDDGNPNSIPNNSVDEIQQAINGSLWIHTGVGYCIYQYDKERFDRKPEEWLKTIGVDGPPYKLLIDSKKNMWMSVYGQGIYFVDVKNMTAFLFPFSKTKSRSSLPDYQVSCIREDNGQAVVTFDNGVICRLDGYAQQVVWMDRFILNNRLSTDHSVFTFVDSKNNYWVNTNLGIYVYHKNLKKWFVGAKGYLATFGFNVPAYPGRKVIIRDMARDKQGHMWIATDHNGLIYLDYAKKICRQFMYNPNDKGSISDNSLPELYVDDNDALWVGTYKNGVNYYSASSTKFYTIPLGDVCTITQDLNGNLWCGTNDAGIVAYNPTTGQSSRFYGAKTGLGSEVVVSSTTMKDGTLYFGTFNGGLARLSHGVWKSYHAGTSGLANNSVWCLAEAPDHRLLIGTLGGGFQIFDPNTEKFETYNTSNSKLTSNFINSLFMQNANQLLLGHSQNMSVFDFHDRKITDLSKLSNGKAFLSPSINYSMIDSRGLLWIATPSGIAMYDLKSNQVENINNLNGTPGAVGCSIIEDKNHTMWLVSEFVVTHVKVDKDEDGKWNLKITNYNSLDGLQERQFNYRSACLMRNGDIAIGGQDGVNIISPRSAQNAKNHVCALFSGVVLFDHALTAGEEYEGRVILEESLDASHRLDLSYKDNAFTIQLASSEVTVPSRNRFLYRMKGVTDKWLLTPADRPEVTFTNLSSGSYILQVKVVNGDGTVNDEISELEINVAPPFYLSIWAFLVYIALIAAIFYRYRHRMIERQRNQFERKSMEESIRKTKELNELKLNFFTNVSHELRTPLTLIISPLVTMIREEADPAKRRKLELIHRNATRLLNLVNQILDFRKFDQNKEKLNLSKTEIVGFVDNICASFRILANNKVKLVFESEFAQLNMSVDVDKVGKIVNNLLSNAYKFTPDGGKIVVSLRAKTRYEMKGGDHDMLCISVADNGKGISDDEKKNVFERFYQVNGTEMQPAGGSGIGLNLVKKFAELHGGKVSVHDNSGGGSVFVVELPIDDDGAAKVNAHLGTMRAAPVFTTVHGGDEETSSEESGDASASLYGMARPLAQTVETTGSVRKPILLLVDDSDDFREFMRDLLSDYTVVEAVNGQDAWNKIIDHRPDIILSDVMMPVMDGNELCRQVKENDETASIPFVMLTARLADEHRKEGLMSGADEYITKPFNIDMLNLRLRNLLNLVKRTGTVAKPTGEVVKEKQLNNGQFVLGAADQKFIEDIDLYIRDNMSNPDTSVESMSAHLCISRVQLYKRMISLMGTTPSEYLRAKRIKYAEHLLHSNEYNISEIAYKVGFNNPRYFSKYFQEAYGVTPSQYKKNLEAQE